MRENSTSPKNGDIFKICIDENIYSYGQIIDLKYNLFSIYESSNNENEDLENIIKKQIIFFTILNNSPFKYDNWMIVGNIQIPKEIEFRKSKVILEEGSSISDIIESAISQGIDLLDELSNVSPKEIESAIKSESNIEMLYDKYEKIIYQPYKRYKEINEIIKKTSYERYEYFIKNSVYFGEIWALYNEGWAIIEDDKGNEILPLWPNVEFAKMFIKSEWIGYTPIAINLNEFINEWIDDMEDDKLKASIFWVDGESIIPELSKLKSDIKNEMKKYSFNGLDELSNIPLSYRYQYFIDKICISNKVWLLYKDGFALIDYDNEVSRIPIWSKMEYAKTFIDGEFEGYSIESMQLDEFIEYFLPDLYENNISIDINYDGEGSVAASAVDILETLTKNI